MAFSPWVRGRLEQIVYVVAGLPIAVRGSASAPSPAARTILEAYRRRYWHPATVREGAELAIGIVLAPVLVPLAASWFTLRNGAVIRRREGKGIAAQFAEQVRLYFSAGVLAPWYYILSLHRDGARRAPTFLQRCETKRGIYALVSTQAVSPLGDKNAFAERCSSAGVRCIACELVVDGNGADGSKLPDRDLFVKPLTGRGGRGAERWDRTAPRRWTNGDKLVSDQELVEELATRGRPMIVQKRCRPHPALEPLTSGALPTVRALTIIDERGRPELVAAVFRMSIGANRTVDNIHAGGLACRVLLAEGVLGLASNLGADARLGWCSRHPTTGAEIEGTRLPFWKEAARLAVQAHRAFSDRLLIGWDIGILEDGPIVLEGNRGPDMDLMQRFMETGFMTHRFGELIAWHLKLRGVVGPAGA
jgi:hypothetical protein